MKFEVLQSKKSKQIRKKNKTKQNKFFSDERKFVAK